MAKLLERYSEALLLFWNLDLEPARHVLQSCYAPNPRGGKPRDPVVMLRCFLLAIAVGTPSLNEWSKELKASRILCVLSGLADDDPPGVGTFYDFMHRIHDGPQRRNCQHLERPSEQERRRAKEPRKRRKKPSKKQRKRSTKNQEKLDQRRRKRDARKEEARQRNPLTSDAEIQKKVTEKLVAELEATKELPNGNDLLQRLSTILLEVAVVESGRRGLLGDLGKLVLIGDGSPLRTGASGAGKRLCNHGRHEKCDCPKLYADPDAEWGYDSYRKCYFFGYHFHEISVPTMRHDLPLALYLGPGNETDHTAAPKNLDRLGKNLRERSGYRVEAFVHDCGVDSAVFFQHARRLGLSPVVPLRTSAPAEHPRRPGLHLSKRGVPLCRGNVEMAFWGSAGRRGKRRVFICPKKAGTCSTCPLAPEGEPGWVCRPELRLGPTTSLPIDEEPRLCPDIPRNSPRYRKLMRLRSGCERSNAVKKETFKLERARHRRASFWLIRLHLIAILQHVKAWCKAEGSDAHELVRHLLGESESPELAAA